LESRIVEVDLTSGRIESRPVPEALENLGGRGLTSSMLCDALEPRVHPLGAKNILIIAPGLLAGSVLSSFGRLSAGAKSPLTGTIKEANSGGVVGGYLGRLGIKAIVFRGRPENEPLLGLKVSAGGAELVDLEGLRGRTVYESAAILREEFGTRCGFVINGPAGEMRMPTACLSVTDPEGEPCRNLGRGGLGAVAGSKGLKAVIVDPQGARLQPHDPDGLKDLIKRFTAALRAHPTTGEKFQLYGTVMTLLSVNSLGGLPTRNFSSGVFEHAENLGGETLYQTIKGRGGDHAHGCMPGCVIRCSNKYVDESGAPIVGSVDYETVCLLGSNLGLASLDHVAVLNKMCNDVGVDTMETGAALGVLGEAGVFDFGDYVAIKRIIGEIFHGTPLGRLVGSGAESCGRAYGVERVPAVKGQGMAAYDPRAIKGMGLTYSMSPMGADHTAGNAITLEVDHLDPDAQLDLVRELHAKTMVLDTLGGCLFTGRVSLAEPEFIEQAVKVITGRDVTFDELKREGMDRLRSEREFNRRAGFTDAHDRLPDFMREEPLAPSQTVYDVSEADHRKFYD